MINKHMKKMMEKVFLLMVYHFLHRPVDCASWVSLRTIATKTPTPFTRAVLSWRLLVAWDGACLSVGG